MASHQAVGRSRAVPFPGTWDCEEFEPATAEFAGEFEPATAEFAWDSEPATAEFVGETMRWLKDVARCLASDPRGPSATCTRAHDSTKTGT